MELHPFTFGVATSMGILQVRISSQQVEPIKQFEFYSYILFGIIYINIYIYAIYLCFFFLGGGVPSKK